MSASALPSTLRSVTATKIGELKKQRDIYESTKSAIGDLVKSRKLGLDKTRALVEGTCRLEGVRILTDSDSEDESDYSRSSKAKELKTSHRLLHLASLDPAFPSTAVEKIFGDITGNLDLRSVQHQHALFFSELVTEWISNSEGDATATGKGESQFESVGRKEMHEQRAEWERIVFAENDEDATAINAYLETLFRSHVTVRIAHDDLKKGLSSFCHSLRESELFDTESLKTTLKGLVAGDLLSEEKKAILRTFASNKQILKEVADVLNMRFHSLETWERTTINGAINLEQRRQLNGKYRVFMDEDILDALLVHAIGMRWAVQLKFVLTKFFNSWAWQRSGNTVPVADRERREWYLGKEEEKVNVPTTRRKDYAAHYFMTQLPEDISEDNLGYDDDGSSNDDRTTLRKSPLETKHSLLHLLIAESLVARDLHPDRSHTVMRSDFKWFGPSLSHTTIFAILQFFGVDEFWLTFFRKFLGSPLRFTQDGENGEIKVRTRGVPMSHNLSDALSETVLFVMDFAVNHSTKTNLYRLHDDFWFWGSIETCKRAWHEMTVFCQVTGIEFNQEKTGSVTFPSTAADSDSDTDLADTPTGLPKGDVRWGFLRLNRDTVRFEIDQAMVDEHIKELKYQLDGCTSMFSYIQAYNSYLARFFSNNFGKPSLGFGRQHIDMMISTLARIQKTMFPNGRVTDHLSREAIKRFNLKDDSFPEGFWYFPVAMGGMEVRNPLIPLIGMRESLRRSPERILQKALERDEAKYLEMKDRYERSNKGSGVGEYNAALKTKMMASGETDTFMSREEYLKFREERSQSLHDAYNELLSVPEEVPLASTPGLEHLLGDLPKNKSRVKGTSGISKPFTSMDPYWQWIVAVHGPEIVKKFGGLQMVDPGQVPLGVVSVMKAGKIRWRG